MPTLPSLLALTTITDGSLAVATDVRGNYSSIQTAVNTLLQELDDGAAGDVLTGVGTTIAFAKPPGYEYAYNDVQSGTISITATTEGTATTVVTASAVTFDGSTPVVIEFYAPYVSKGTTFTRVYLYDGSNSIGFIGHVDASGGVPFRVARRLTPSAASHTYSIRASVDAGTGSVIGGAGGLAAYMPAFIRITKV